MFGILLYGFLTSGHLSIDHLAQLDYPMEICDINCAPNNEAIVRTLMTLKKAENEDFKDNFDFKTPFSESLENGKPGYCLPNGSQLGMSSMSSTSKF